MSPSSSAQTKGAQSLRQADVLQGQNGSQDDVVNARDSQDQDEDQSQFRDDEDGDTQGQAQSRPRMQGRKKRVRPGPLNRCRAARACQKCNEKRVKCDASERGIPCTRCVDKGETDCKLIQSRRGTYARKMAEERRKEKEDNIHCLNDTNVNETIVADDTVDDTMENNGDTTNQRQEPVSTSQPQPPAARSVEPEGESNLELESEKEPEPEISPGGTGNTDTPASGEASWVTLFSHLLEDRNKGRDIVDKGSITYLGESFPLALILKDLKGSASGLGSATGSSSWRQLHHPGPPCPADEEQSHASPRTVHPPSMRSEDILYLSAKGAFETPKQAVVDAFIDVFLNRVYPLYPIVNRAEFLEQHQNKRTPWILLHAACLASATFCPIQLIHQAGFESRRAARWSFYSKAKALFDLSYESDKIVALQVTILMTFWGGGPNMYWNFYSWVNTGVTIAETLGCHRTMAGTNISPQDRSLLKRIWWVLVIRDSACAALVGRPFRINMDHCDLDELALSDFEHCTPTTAGLYQIEAAKLSLILRDIIMIRFSARKDPTQVPMALHFKLTDWRAKLPSELAWTDNSSRQSNVLSSCLAVTYNHHMILAHLNCSINPMQPSQPSSEDLSSHAAQQIAAISCGVITRREILTAPHEFLHGIFIAAVVFYKMTKSSQQILCQLGTAGLTNCQMALHETYESWDPSPWIQHILDKISRRRSDNFVAPGAEKENLPHPIEGQPMASYLDAYELPPFDESLISPRAVDLWQSYPVLGDLFDLGTSATENVVPTPDLGDQTGGLPWA